MRLFIVAVVLIAGRAAWAGVADECRRGPSYWCQSLQKAVPCRAFTHCLQTVWQPQLIDVKQTDVCLSTQELVKKLRRALSVDKETVEPLVTSLCDNADDDTTKRQCEDTMSEFLPQVVGLLNSTAEPTSVAVLLGLCQQDEDQPTLETEYTELSREPVCQDCYAFLSDVQKLLTKPGVQEMMVTAVTEGVCSHFSDLKIWCKSVVDIGVPRLFKFLEENNGADTLCGLTPFCVESHNRKLKTRQWFDVISQLVDDIDMDTDKEVICHDCEKTLTSFLRYEKESPIRMSIENAVAHLCSLMSSKNEEMCRLLSEGFSRIPEELLHGMASSDVDVATVCRAVVRCTGSEAPLPQSSLSVADPPAPWAPPRPELPFCRECLKVFDDVSQALKMESSVTWATARAKQTLCKAMGSLEEQCSMMVDVFMPVVAKLLTSGQSSGVLCSYLNLCHEQIGHKTLDFVKAFGATWQPNTLSEVGSFECDVCQLLVQDALALDRDADVQKAVVNFFNDICDELGQMASECKDFVKKYSVDLFELIANELDSTVICELLLNCTKPMMTEDDEPALPVVPEEAVIGQDSSQPEPVSHNHSASPRHRHVTKKAKKAKRAVQKAGQQKEEDSVLCSVCLLAMKAVDATVASNATEAAVKEMLDEVCSLLPSEVTQPCEQFVDTYSATVIQLLLQQLEPVMICDELQLCNQTLTTRATHLEEEKEQLMAPVEEEEEQEIPGDSIQCEVCQLVVQTLDKVISENGSEAAIEKALDEVCQLLPQSMRTGCVNFVDQYAPVVIQLLLQELKPDTVCKFLQLCQQEEAVNMEPPQIKDTPPRNTDHPNSSYYKKETSSEVSGQEACLVCQTLANYLQEALSEQATQDELEKLLEDACTLLPQDLTATCDKIVEQYTPVLLEFLVEKDDPLAVCKELKLCPSGSPVRTMKLKAKEEREQEPARKVGVDPCTYGPSFWCASMDNARSCGMVSECVQKYGMKP